MANTIDDLKKVILDSILDRASRFLADHADARVFLQDRATRLAKLGFDLMYAGSEEERKSIENDMKVVRQSMENEISRVALDAKPEAKTQFMEIVNLVVQIFAQMLPAILRSIRG